MKGRKILIIEDDSSLLEELRQVYEDEGFLTYKIDDFKEVMAEIYHIDPDLIVLDLGLPGLSGFDILTELRENTLIPILILTSRDSLEVELTSLDMGADDFLTKPVDRLRLIARSKKLLNIYDKFNDKLILKSLGLEPSTNKLAYKSQFVILSQAEADLLAALIKAYPATVSKDELLREAWHTAFIDENILQVNLTRLRKKLKLLGLADIIVNVRSVGYRLAGDKL